MYAPSVQDMPTNKSLWLTSKERAAVNSKTLLAFYLVIPFCALLVMADMLLLDGTLLQYLPSSPTHWLIWAIVFETPHIVASFFSFCDREYIRHYRSRLISAVSVIVPLVLFFVVVAPAVFPDSIASLLLGLFSVLFVVYTMYHVLSQQFGIAIGLMKIRPDYRYELLRWGATLSGALMYALVLVDREMMFIGVSFGVIFQWACAGLIALTCVVGWNISKTTNERKGKLFLYTNLIMLVCVYLFLHVEYSIFVLIIPRFVHDLTALYVYGVHDHNRNMDKKNNFLYRPFYALSPIVVCPVLAVGIGNLVDMGNTIIPVIGLMLGLLHYYMEGFIWKGNSLHRQFVAFR
jgi:hypothetical protein